MRITAEMLWVKGACADQIVVFETEWPKGCEVTHATVRRACDMGLDVGWAIHEFAPPEALVPFREAILAARRTYEQVKVAAGEMYDQAIISAITEVFHAEE